MQAPMKEGLCRSTGELFGTVEFIMWSGLVGAVAMFVCCFAPPNFSCEGIPSARQAGGLAVTIEPAVATG